ncbi:hypothetical protein PUNSTDRAFT_129275 [Punctularia strigosozonata HHB-11173 SS5]|uniref:uncharacterized protein n=1 Tax=Punctularia strigosozonata (strain HHB-11173) TaxID=741275 RepID=UPI0004417D65|nr:uncharacterized protein PUNSTDRAFT_129275 [Punctularia strigosozonata HHB-11173 SS5]EIN13597.1 hypothetical protein PUNSTDRAFT_129275 [Punctularia strigosozonata HHB-11173 SS5]
MIARGIHWPRFYWGSLTLSAINLLFISLAFRPTVDEQLKEKAAAVTRQYPRPTTHAVNQTPDPMAASEPEFEPQSPVSPTPTFVAPQGYYPRDTKNCPVGPSEKIVTPLELPSPSGVTPQLTSSATLVDDLAPKKTLLRALGMPYLWAFALFTWCYSGCETATQGFMVDYLLQVRNAPSSTAGYVTSGYWAGQTISRFMWGSAIPSMTFTHRKYVIHVCLFVALAMYLVIWLVPSVFGDAFAASIVGLVYGPMFPGALGLAIDVLPCDVTLVSMAILSWFASFGSGSYPELTFDDRPLGSNDAPIPQHFSPS